jgi:hypothetical protein
VAWLPCADAVNKEQLRGALWSCIKEFSLALKLLDCMTSMVAQGAQPQTIAAEKSHWEV